MTKLLLADNQAIFRAGIAKVLAVEDDVRIIGQVQTAEQLFPAIEKLKATLLIIAGDFYHDFAEVVGVAARNGIKVIVIADNSESAQPYTAAGALGVVYRNVSGPAFVECLQTVAAGKSCVLVPETSGELTENDMVGLRVRDRLTPKELRITALIVQGYKNKDIAMELGTTEQVIKNYLRSIYDKTGVSDRLELALFTIHHRTLNEAAADMASRPQTRSRRMTAVPVQPDRSGMAAAL